MIILLHNVDTNELLSFKEHLNMENATVSQLEPYVWRVDENTRVVAAELLNWPVVKGVLREESPYPLAEKALCENVPFSWVAGPCAIEPDMDLIQLATDLKNAGATMLRGGTFKPRTSPYSYQGMGADGIKKLIEAGNRVGLPVISEIVDPAHLPLYKGVSMLQIGTRNMQNYPLLRAVGQSKIPVLLKRGMANTMEEWLQASEYILREGNPNIVLCERGIRTAVGAGNATIDLNGLCWLREHTGLPVWLDPSHAGGKAAWVPTLAKAGVACGVDGIIVEVHPSPQDAWSDAQQALSVSSFTEMRKECDELRNIIRK